MSSAQGDNSLRSYVRSEVVSVAPQPTLPFKRLGEYEVVAPIAEGGMATVWLGRSIEHPDQLVALKVIRPEHVRNKEFLAMFVDEARIASRLFHPNIIAIRNVGHEGKRRFLAMEVLRGRTLSDVWGAAHARGERLPYEVIAWIGARIADALHYAHELCDEHGAPQNIVHRDVNPANIVLTRGGVPKLIDFGLAKARDRLASTAVGIVKGKLAYLAPEQAQGSEADRRADVFALGVTLWELTLDRRLLRGDSDVETVRRAQKAEIPDPTTLDDQYPRALAQAVMRALAREPGDRWQTAAELREALDAFVRGTGKAVDSSHVRALVAIRSDTDNAAANWERHIEEATVGPERIRVWDDEQQRLTWMHASIETAVPVASNDQADRALESPPTTRRERLDRALAERLSTLDPREDRVAVARAYLERAVVDEVLGDASKAARHAEASLEALSTGAAHEMLRRLEHTRGAAAALLAHIDVEIADCAADAARADLLAERARLLEASQQPVDAVRAAWERVLTVSPMHAAALKGREAALVADPKACEALAGHLGRMAQAYATEPRLAAWLHVDRARLLDRRLAQPDAAKAALVQALQIDGGVGLVRTACVQHAAVHRDAAWLMELLTQEAALESDPARSAQLELDAACVARQRLGDADRAVSLLESAVARVPISPSVHKRVLDDLLALHETAGRGRDALRIRRLRLSTLSDPRARANELRAIAALEESLGDRHAAIAALDNALDLHPHAGTLAEELDRLLEIESMTERRIQLCARQAAAAENVGERARLLVRAAVFAESAGDGARAVDLLRAALVAHPADDQAVDGLVRLLSRPPATAYVAEARALIAVHAHAAQHAIDDPRRVVHLEAMALLEEGTIGDPSRAATLYETILRVEPGRRAAILGLQRAAARVGDGARLAHALLDEAKALADPKAADSLRVRAAGALAAIDPERALAIACEVLSRAPWHAEASRVAQHIHEAAGRWGQIDVILAVRIEHAHDDRARVDLWLARAELQRTRLRATQDALASLRAALAIDPRDPAIREAMVAHLRALGDAVALRDGLVELASSEPLAPERARAIASAAEIDELVLLDDAHAAQLYEQALACLPDDPWICDRRIRLLFRRACEGHSDDLHAALNARLERDPTNPAHSLELALALLDEGGDIARATSLVDDVIAHTPAAPQAVRVLERIARATGAAPLLANALARQVEAFQTNAPKLGALWAEAALVEWTLPGGDTTETVECILGHAPTDRAALDAAVRLAMPAARAGEATARARLITALRTRLAEASGDTEKLLLNVALALTLEPEQDVRDHEKARAALGHYREALRVDPRSVVGAAGSARLGTTLGDAEATVAGAIAQADLAPDPQQRAAFLVQAAGQVLSGRDARLGARPDRLVRAGELLEHALDADPESLPAVGLLSAVRSEDGMRDRLLGTLRAAFDRARSAGAVVHLGGEVARVALIDPPDRVLAIDALRRVLSAAPGNTTTLRALADQYAAQGAWGEAVQALEMLAASTREPHAKLRALFELSDLYARTLSRSSEVERVLRSALDVDPANVQALRGLLVQRRSAGAAVEEVASLLGRISDAETAPDAKAVALAELAELRLAIGDAAAAERALVEATAQAPTVSRIERLAKLHAAVPAEQARAFSAVVARAEELGRPDAACLAALGQIEIALGRWPDGVTHLRIALALGPAMHEARAALAKGLVHVRAPAEATPVLAPMIAPDASPLLSLRDPADALATLEYALRGEGRSEEAVVARELRVIAGGLDDGAHAELRARRLVVDPASPAHVVLDPATLRGSVLPNDHPALLFEVAAALAGIEGKLARVDLEELGVSPGDRLAPASGHPLLALVHRFATMLGIARPEVALSRSLPRARVVAREPALLVVPEAMADQSEPMQAATLTRLLVRIALSVPWLEDLPAAYAHAMLCGAARQVVPGYASDFAEAGQRELVNEFAQRVARAIGRRQKRALAELAPALSEMRVPTLADTALFERAVAQTELRAAFVMTGDLLATVDTARALDGELALATANVGVGALGATLAHPLTGDTARFALASSTTALRRRAGTLW
jgi:serine/threonine protein kinase/tetratricopeptide (TPR) repeat protein